MRFITFIFILFTLSGISQTGIRDYQLVSDTPFDSLQVMVNDTNSSSPTYKYGSWINAREFINSMTSGGGADSDWYKTGTTDAPTNAETAFRTGTTIIGTDGTYTGLLSVTGRIDQRFPGAALNNIMIGRSAGNTSMTGDNNIGIGYLSLASITSGTPNIAIGFNVLNGVTTGASNVGVGYRALENTTSSNNFGLGTESLLLNTSGATNIAIGSESLRANSTASDNIGIGYRAGKLNQTGSQNVFIGNNAGAATDTEVERNVFVGYSSGSANTGTNNIFLGYSSGSAETGSNRLYIENSNSATPLIYGEFDNDLIKINGRLGYTTEGSTATTLAGRDASEYFTNITVGAGLDLTAGTMTATDESETNEAWTVDADDVSTEVISNQTLKFEGGAGIVTDYVSGTPDKVTFIVDGDEFTTVTTPEADDYILFHDENGAGADALEKILYSDIYDLIIAEAGADGNGIFDAANDGASVGNSTFDVAVPGYINFDANTFVVDGAGNMVGIGTVAPGVLLDIESATANLRIKDTNGGTGNTIMLISDYGAGTGITGGISFQYDATEQYDIEANKRSSTQSTLTISGEQATDAEIVYEKNADLQDNTTESHLAINGGIAYTQNYEWTGTSSDLTLDRSYYNVFVTGSGGIGDEINLPNVFSASDNWISTMTTTDCQVGQEYVITNFRAATNLVVRTNSGDFIDGAATTTITLTPFQSVIIKCVRLNGTTGYWMSYD